MIAWRRRQRDDGAGGGQRHVRVEQAARHRADAGRADDVAGDARRAAAVGERRSSDRIHGIPQLRAESGEIAEPLRRARHDGLRRSGLAAIPEPLVRAEPEQLVLHDRATGRGPRLVLLLRRLSRLKEGLRVQLRVAMELPSGSVEAVGTGLGHDTDLAAGRMTVLGSEVVRLDADFLHRVGRRRIEPGRLVEVREHRAIQGEQVVIRVAAIDGHDRSLPAVGRVLLRAD